MSQETFVSVESGVKPEPRLVTGASYLVVMRTAALSICCAVAVFALTGCSSSASHAAPANSRPSQPPTTTVEPSAVAARILCPSVSRAAVIESLRKGWGDLARFRHNRYRAKLAFASDFGSWSRTDAVRPSDVVWLVEVQGRVPTLSSGLRKWAPSPTTKASVAWSERTGDPEYPILAGTRIPTTPKVAMHPAKACD